MEKAETGAMPREMARSMSFPILERVVGDSLGEMRDAALRYAWVAAARTMIPIFLRVYYFGRAGSGKGVFQRNRPKIRKSVRTNGNRSGWRTSHFCDWVTYFLATSVSPNDVLNLF